MGFNSVFKGLNILIDRVVFDYIPFPVVEKKTRIFVFNNFYFFENCAVYDLIWENMADRGWPQTKIWRMRTACLVTEATDTYSEYVKVIAFPLQQCLHERTSVLHFTCILSFLLTFCQTAVTVQVSCFQLE